MRYVVIAIKPHDLFKECFFDSQRLLNQHEKIHSHNPSCSACFSHDLYFYSCSSLEFFISREEGKNNQ